MEFELIAVTSKLYLTIEFSNCDELIILVFANLNQLTVAIIIISNHCFSCKCEVIGNTTLLINITMCNGYSYLINLVLFF